MENAFDAVAQVPSLPVQALLQRGGSGEVPGVQRRAPRRQQLPVPVDRRGNGIAHGGADQRRVLLQIADGTTGLHHAVVGLEAASEDPEERARAEEDLGKDPIFEALGGGVAGARMAFGPFLVLAIIEYLLVGPVLFERYFRWMGY